MLMERQPPGKKFADASQRLQPAVMEMNSSFWEGDSQPALRLVHLVLGVRGGHTG